MLKVSLVDLRAALEERSGVTYITDVNLFDRSFECFG